MSETQNTQNNVNMCKKGIIMNEYVGEGYKFKYTGEVVILPLDYESKRNKKIQILEEKNTTLDNSLKAEKENSAKWQKRAKEERAKLDAERKVSEQLKAERIKLQAEIIELQEKLNKFTNNGRATKLLPEVKDYIQKAYIQGLSVVQMFKALSDEGWDISYETIRRYVSSIKKSQQDAKTDSLT